MLFVFLLKPLFNVSNWNKDVQSRQIHTSNVAIDLTFDKGYSVYFLLLQMWRPKYSQTYIQRSPLGQRKNDETRQDLCINPVLVHNDLCNLLLPKGNFIGKVAVALWCSCVFATMYG